MLFHYLVSCPCKPKLLMNMSHPPETFHHSKHIPGYFVDTHMNPFIVFQIEERRVALTRCPGNSPIAEWAGRWLSALRTIRISYQETFAAENR